MSRVSSPSSLLMFVLATAAPAGAGPPHTATTTAADRTAVAVTVYNDGRGLVREERTVELPAGASELQFVDVAQKIEAPTVHVAVLDGGAVAVLEQNYEYDLLSPQKLLEKFVGQTIILVQQKMRDSSTVEEDVPAKLLSTNSGTVWEIGGRIVTNPPYSRLSFPSVPENLIAHPTLVWLVEAAGAGRRKLEAAYLTSGMSWHADYVLALDPSEEKGGLQGWVTIDNQSGVGFKDARLKVVAGDVHRASPPAQIRVAGAMAKEMFQTASAMREEGLFEYHLYTLERPTTIKDNQTKQVQLLDSPSFGVSKDYVLRGSNGYYRSVWGPGNAPEKVQVFLNFKNSKSNGLGMPLPKGVVRVYKRDASGSPQFIGEDNVDHTPKDEGVRLEMGNAFDVSAERKQTDFKRIASNVFESAYEVKLRNHKEGPVTVRVIEPIGGDWTMVQNSQPFTKTGAFEAEFDVPVARDVEAVLTYRVRATY
jgi:hypothetical protein